MDDVPSDEIAPIADDDQLRIAIFDVRSPITAIRGWAELLREEPIASEKVFNGQETLGEALEVILENAKRIEQTWKRIAIYSTTKFKERKDETGETDTATDLPSPPQNNSD